MPYGYFSRLLLVWNLGWGEGSSRSIPALFPQKYCIQLDFHSFPDFLFCLTKELQGKLNINKAHSTV